MSSTSNPRVQAARKLHRRKTRDAERAFLIEGTIQLQEALEAGADILEVFVEDPGGGELVEQLCRAHGLPFVRVDRVVGKVLSQSVTPQGVVAVVRSPGVTLEEIPAAADLVLVLAEVRDPGNAGTLIRSAAAAGADAAVFSTRAVDALGPKTVRAAAGAVFRIPLVLDAPLPDALSSLRSRGFVIVGTDPRAQLALDACDLTRRIVLVVGNEAWGMPSGMEHLVDEIVGIPMPGSTESLNVAAAGSILLFEAVRQRRLSSEQHP